MRNNWTKKFFQRTFRIFEHFQTLGKRIAIDDFLPAELWKLHFFVQETLPAKVKLRNYLQVFLMLVGLWAQTNSSLANLFRQGFQNCSFFVQLTFTWKISWPECVHFVLFLDFQHKKLADTAEKNSAGASKLLFPGPEELCAKKTFPLRQLTIFCSVSDFEPKKLRFSMKPFQQSCQNCYVWCPRNTPSKNRSTEITTILFIFFRFFTKKNWNSAKLLR